MAMTGEPAVPIPPDMRSGPMIVGVDDPVACGRPLRAAVFLARAAGRPVLLVHVRKRSLPMVEGYVPLPDEASDTAAENEIERKLTDTLSASPDLQGVAWELVSVTGDAANELLRLAADRDAACIVVGRRHKGFADVIHRIAEGSVSRAVLAAQQCPVLVVP
jgi:nucleotide-binding universal stress UspA family protein